jgi:hypothetical protein
MPYIDRDSSGNIIGIYAVQQQAGQEFVQSATLYVAPTADPAGFAQAVKVGMGGILAANALMVAYPAFFPAIQTQAWSDVQALVADAKAKATITTAQYNAIKAAAGTFNIPVAL